MINGPMMRCHVCSYDQFDGMQLGYVWYREEGLGRADKVTE